jgi:hypothetical protein
MVKCKMRPKVFKIFVKFVQIKLTAKMRVLSLVSAFISAQPAIGGENDKLEFEVLDREFMLELPAGYCGVPDSNPYTIFRFQDLNSINNHPEAVFSTCDSLVRSDSVDSLLRETIRTSHGWVTSFPKIDTNGQEALNNSILRSLGDHRKIEEFRNVGSMRGLDISFSEHTVFRLDRQLLVILIPVKVSDPNFGETSRLLLASGININHRTIFVYLSLNLDTYSTSEVVDILGDFSASIQNFE